MVYIFYFLVVYAVVIMAFSYDFNGKGAAYLIVLGSKLNDNRETFTMVTRADRAALYLQKNPECMAIVSGGVTKGNSISEASVLRMLLLERGIRPERIIVEDKALNTFENFKYSKKLLDPEKKITICTSDYHILRSKLMAAKNGLKVNSIFAHSTVFDLLIHLPIEEIFIIKNMIEKQA